MEWFQEIILELFNQIWEQKLYPSDWNEVFILPIFKSGSYTDVNNYRGIAIMSCLGKLFSILVNSRLYTWAETNDKISMWQGGFRRKLGCDVQCFRLLTAICIQTSRKNAYYKKLQGRVFACFVDFKKAYDSVNHIYAPVEKINESWC